MYTEEKCKKEIFKFASILMKVYHTSFLVSFTGKKKQEVFGSEKVKKKFKDTFKSDDSWLATFRQDSEDLSTQPQGSPDHANAYNNYLLGEGIPKLPQKLSLMNLAECAAYLTQATKLDYYERKGKSLKRIDFRDPDSEPSWWGNRIWPFGMITKKFTAARVPAGRSKVKVMKEMIEHLTALKY